MRLLLVVTVALLGLAGSAFSQAALSPGQRMLTDTNSIEMFSPLGASQPRPTPEPPKIVSLEEYLKALLRLASVKISLHGTSLDTKHMSDLILMAQCDSSLEKSPEVKRLTLGLFAECLKMETLERMLAGESTGTAGGGQQNMAHMMLGEPSMKKGKSLDEVRAGAYQMRRPVVDAADKWIEAIDALLRAPGEVAFSMPADSRYYAVLSEAHGPKPVEKRETKYSYIQVEVVEQSPKGFYAYLKSAVPVRSGVPLKDEEIKEASEVDRSKRIFISYYPRPVSFGQSLAFVASHGEERMVDGQSIAHYSYSHER